MDCDSRDQVDVVDLPDEPEVVESNHLVRLVGHLVDVPEQIIIHFGLLLSVSNFQHHLHNYLQQESHNRQLYLLTPSLVPSAQLGLQRT